MRLARLLLRVQDNKAWHAVAYKLYTSVCELVGVDGSLIKNYQLTDKGENMGLLVDDEVIYSVAEAYPLLVENNWYPSSKSLDTTKNNVWIYGAAKNIKVLDARRSNFKIVVEGVKGASEYFVLRNVPNLKNIIIHGLDYRSDPNFETYNSSGYVYNASTSTLYLKIRHKQDTEDIVLQME